MSCNPNIPCGGGPVLCTCCGKLHPEHTSKRLSQLTRSALSHLTRQNRSQWVCAWCLKNLARKVLT